MFCWEGVILLVDWIVIGCESMTAGRHGDIIVAVGPDKNGVQSKDFPAGLDGCTDWIGWKPKWLETEPLLESCMDGPDGATGWEKQRNSPVLFACVVITVAVDKMGKLMVDRSVISVYWSNELRWTQLTDRVGVWDLIGCWLRSWTKSMGTSLFITEGPGVNNETLSCEWDTGCL